MKKFFLIFSIFFCCRSLFPVKTKYMGQRQNRSYYPFLYDSNFLFYLDDGVVYFYQKGRKSRSPQKIDLSFDVMSFIGIEIIELNDDKKLYAKILVLAQDLSQYSIRIDLNKKNNPDGNYSILVEKVEKMTWRGKKPRQN